jgi:phosphatidylinositol alpha-mannosyltransferase
MKLAFLHVTLPPDGEGGVAYQVDLLARSMVDRGHDVTCFATSPIDNRRPYRTFVVEPQKLGVVTPILGVGLAFRKLDLTPFDVVHAHGDAWALHDSPVVRTFHGSAFAEARSATNLKRKVAQGLGYLLELEQARRSTVLTGVSEASKRYLPRSNVLLIPNAVDSACFFPGSERNPDPTILFVAGRLGGRKRGHLVLRAFRDVRRQVRNARLIVVSRDTVNGEGIESRQEVSSQELGDLYRRSWVLCSASSYEGFGLPYAEAITTGLPIVTTDNPGAHEILQGGRLGKIVAERDLAPALVQMLTDETLANQFRQAGLEASHRYDLGTVSSSYEAAYRSAMEIHRHSSTASV